MTASAMPARDRQPRSSSTLTWRKTSAVGSSIVTKVLYIEDNDDNVYMLKMRLELLGDFEVLTAEDGEKGCEMAAAERPDIILMDLEMPVVDGWEATRRLKGNPQTREIPIVALSAHALAGEREKALAAGCDEFDTKPIEFDRLVATLRRALTCRKRCSISEGRIGWRYGLIRSLAVNSRNLMERGPKFCTAEERATGPNARSEAPGSLQFYLA